MANIYDDFDKRREHDRRFAETQPDDRNTVYGAPKKAHPLPKAHRFHSGVLQGLLDALLNLEDHQSPGEKR